jgi:hypothetical protein
MGFGAMAGGTRPARANDRHTPAGYARCASDPRTTGDMPRSGLVRLFHASEAAAADLSEAGLSPGSDGVIWLASAPEIADLQNSAGTRAREIQAIVEVAVDAKLLEYERTTGDLHIFYLLAGDPFTVISVDHWPTLAASSSSDCLQTTPNLRRRPTSPRRRTAPWLSADQTRHRRRSRRITPRRGVPRPSSAALAKGAQRRHDRIRGKESSRPQGS